MYRRGEDLPVLAAPVEYLEEPGGMDEQRCALILQARPYVRIPDLGAHHERVVADVLDGVGDVDVLEAGVLERTVAYLGDAALVEVYPLQGAYVVECQRLDLGHGVRDLHRILLDLTSLRADHEDGLVLVVEDPVLGRIMLVTGIHIYGKERQTADERADPHACDVFRKHIAGVRARERDHALASLECIIPDHRSIVDVEQREFDGTAELPRFDGPHRVGERVLLQDAAVNVLVQDRPVLAEDALILGNLDVLYVVVALVDRDVRELEVGIEHRIEVLLGHIDAQLDFRQTLARGEGILSHFLQRIGCPEELDGRSAEGIVPYGLELRRIGYGDIEEVTQVVEGIVSDALDLRIHHQTVDVLPVPRLPPRKIVVHPVGMFALLVLEYAQLVGIQLEREAVAAYPLRIGGGVVALRQQHDTAQEKYQSEH